MLDYKTISHFHGLNALRFLAALLVLMQHGEALKQQNGIVNFEWLGLFKNGGNAVSFFFVLSGFLITYLLLKELKNTSTISVNKFYLKRVLRIWPLYFLLVFIGTIGVSLLLPIFHIPYELPYSFQDTWYYFVFFVPGIVTFYYGHHFLEPLWSIGVEEVFYLFWAPLFKWSKNKILRLLLIVLLLKLLINLLAYHFSSSDLLNYIISTFQFEAMAIGGLGAYLLFEHGEKITRGFIFKVPMQILIFSLLGTFLIFHINIDHIVWDFIFKMPVFTGFFLDLLFLYVIICVSVVPHSILQLKNRTMSYLGEISYGIYMYHMLIISTVVLVLKKHLIDQNTLISLIVFYGTTISLTIAVAAFSKHFFESYFLNLKRYLQTRNN